MRRLQRIGVAVLAAGIVAASAATTLAEIEEGATARSTAERILIDGPMTLPGINGGKASGRAENRLIRQDVGFFGGFHGTPGEVRITCGTSHHAYDDPIVAPSEPGASHLHTFFGNAGTNAFSTYESLRAEPRGSTCAGGSANKSAYWFPSLIDGSTNTVVEPTLNFMYYKTGYWGQRGSDVQDIPDGLRMVSGNAAATRPQASWHVQWTCSRGDESGIPGGLIRESPSIPQCEQGNLLEGIVLFPQCWNGRDLDAPDHKSHMAHPNFQGQCPSSHPVLLPQITLHTTFHMGPGGSSSLYLASDMMTPPGAPPGLGFHADFFEAWTPELRTGFVTRCLNNSLDCGVNYLGDGYYLRPL